MLFCSLYKYALPFLLLFQPAGFPAADEQPPEKSAYFAYVGRDYIFTVEVVDPGIPLLNFVSMTDDEGKLLAKNILISLGNRKADVRLFSIETNGSRESMKVTSLNVHPRSSFGFMLEGSFGEASELYGAEIRLGEKRFKLAPLFASDFEILVSKVNRLNLGSPDFRDDFRVLKLELIGQSTTSPR